MAQISSAPFQSGATLNASVDRPKWIDPLAGAENVSIIITASSAEPAAVRHGAEDSPSARHPPVRKS